MRVKIAGCVVLFNPVHSVIENLKTYAEELDLLIIVDNSPVENTTLSGTITSMFGNASYHWLQSNEGIAKALNVACGIAVSHGCEWLLTMDQDSSFDPGGVADMIGHIDEVKRIFPGIGIISPNHKVHEEASLKVYTADKGIVLPEAQHYIEVKVTMTSGNLLNLGAYAAAGPFADQLFIDHVDHEYCLRLRKHQYRIVQLNSVYLNHALGSFEVRSFLGKKLKISNHNYQRRYYITRNGLYVSKHYFSLDRVICLDILKNIFFFDMIKILFFEQKKWLKIKAVWLGICHFAINRYGKYELRK
jgi:rhamnosyltransferase